MTGMYLHIPFCRKACHYCDFHFSTSLKSYADVMAAMKAEIGYWSEAWPSSLQTIYFGGGTPSMLELADLASLLDEIRSKYQIEKAPEITLEVNPEDVTEEKLQGWKELGVNRLSIGVQSFFNEELEWMNRNHQAEASINAVKSAQQAGFENITIDLIYGVPVSSREHWEENLNRALALNVPHISAYALTVEPKTALAHSVQKNAALAPDEEEAHQQFLMLRERLMANGFDAYEISNFGKPGWHSKHNSNYWNGIPYLGIGPGAHSFDGDVRRWNIRNNVLYAKAVQSSEPWYETEQLSVRDRYNETIMTGLRRQEGVSLEEVKIRFGERCVSLIERESKPYLERGWLQWKGDRLCLTEAGLFFADGIAADLFDA